MRRFAPSRARRGSRRTGWFRLGIRLRTTGTTGVGSSTAGECTGARRYDGGNARRLDDRKALSRRDARLPEERRRLRQGRRLAARRRPDARGIGRRRRPRRRQHVRVHRGRAPGVDRRRARARPTRRKPGARLVVTGCMAERYGDELAAALPEADAVVGFADEGALVDVVMRGRKPAGVRDLLELPRPAPSAPWAYVKVAEGCDRACAFCAIPSFRGQAAIAHARGDRGRGARRSSSRASPRSCSSRRTSRGTGATSASRVRSRRCCAGSTRSRAHGLARVRLLYLYPSEVKDPLVSTMLELPTVVPVLRPLAAARGAGSVAPHEAVGERRALLARSSPASAPSSPTPRSARRSSSASPARPKPITRRCSGSSTTCASTGPASSRSRARTAPRPRRWTARSPDSLVHERLRECAEVQEPITAAARAALVGRDDRSARRRGRRRRRAWSGARTVRRPRSTASCGSSVTRRRCSPGRARSCARRCAASKVPISTRRSTP